MYLRHRCVMLAFGALILMTIPGCFLFGGKKETTESAIAATAELREGQIATEEALFRADMAIEEERYDTAVIEYNRAIRADSSNIDAYFELASLHQQLSTQYRSEGNIEAALQENTRALTVLSSLVKYQVSSGGKQSADLTPPESSMMPEDTGMESMMPSDTETMPEGTMPSDTEMMPEDTMMPPAETPGPEEAESLPDDATP